MIHASPTPLGVTAFREQLHNEAADFIAKINGKRRALVTHPDRKDSGVVVDSSEPAWTPNELTVDPPALGMVKVRWLDSVDPTQLYWEYTDELRPVPVA